jgi:hypothetical protein
MRLVANARPDPRFFPLLLTQAVVVASAALHRLCMHMKEGAGAVISTIVEEMDSCKSPPSCRVVYPMY